MQKRVNLVDLVKSFQTSIYLQKSASIQPRTGFSKFPKKSLKVRMKVRTNIGPAEPGLVPAHPVPEPRRRVGRPEEVPEAGFRRPDATALQFVGSISQNSQNIQLLCRYLASMAGLVSAVPAPICEMRR